MNNRGTLLLYMKTTTSPPLVPPTHTFGLCAWTKVLVSSKTAQHETATKRRARATLGLVKLLRTGNAKQI